MRAGADDSHAEVGGHVRVEIDDDIAVIVVDRLVRRSTRWIPMSPNPSSLRSIDVHPMQRCVESC